MKDKGVGYACGMTIKDWVSSKTNVENHMCSNFKEHGIYKVTYERVKSKRKKKS